MDPPPLSWPIHPTEYHSLSPLQAQQLLQRLGWSYYTIWKEASMLRSLGLVWSNGDINRSAATSVTRSGQLVRDVACERDDQNARMGRLSLQRYYRQCFLPLGAGIAGFAMLTRRHQWASGEELLLQISSMSQVQQHLAPAPPHLQAQLFKDASIQTVVCVPLQYMAGVLELGTTDSVPESKEFLDQILDFIGPAHGAAMNSARDHNYYGEPDKQLECRLWNMSNYYCSSSSDSPLSVKSNSNTHGEVSPLILRTTSSAMADFEIDILKQMCIDIATVSTTAASLNHPATISHNQHDVSLKYSTTLSPASLSDHNYDHNYGYDSSNYSDIDIRHVHHDFPIDAVPSNIGLPSSDEASLIQLRQQLQVDFPSCLSLANHQGSYINYAHTHDRGASQLSTPISPGSFIDNSPNSFMTCSSNLKLSTHYGIFKPWTKQNSHIEMHEDAPRSDSLLKRCLLHFLPERHREMQARISAARCDARGSPEILLSHHELSRTYGLHNRNASNIRKGNGIEQQNEGAKQHMIAERKRRRRQSESFRELKSLVPSIIKKDKVTILEHTLHHLKQLQDSVDELTKANHLLIMQAGAATQHATASVMASQQQLLSPAPLLLVEENPLSSPKTNSRLLPSSDVQVLMTGCHGRQLPLFHLSMNVAARHEEANDTVIKVISALNGKSLQCIRVEAEFSENSSSLSVKLLAKFKDAENHTPPSPHELLEIREWWRLLSLTFSRATKDHDEREFQE